MEVMELIGSRVGVQKAMLTVFRSNDRAVKAYESWGYGLDDFSPEARKLRDGTLKELSYVVLSKGREAFARRKKDREQTDPCGMSKLADENEIDNETASAQHG